MLMCVHAHVWSCHAVGGYMERAGRGEGRELATRGKVDLVVRRSRGMAIFHNAMEKGAVVLVLMRGFLRVAVHPV